MLHLYSIWLNLNLSRPECDEGRTELKNKLSMYNPSLAVFYGSDTYDMFKGTKKKYSYGLQRREHAWMNTGNFRHNKPIDLILDTSTFNMADLPSVCNAALYLVLLNNYSIEPSFFFSFFFLTSSFFISIFFFLYLNRITNIEALTVR